MKPRPIIYPDDPDIALVQLTRGKFSVIDRADAELVGHLNWTAYPTLYGKFYAARRNPDWSYLPMHKLIFPAPEGLFTDHIDRDELNNRRHNLRHATFSQNMRNRRVLRNNTSGFTGVTFEAKRNRWRAFIIVNKKLINLGSFGNKEDAAAARKQGEADHFEGFARNG